MYDIFFNKYFPLYRKKHTFAKKFLPYNSKSLLFVTGSSVAYL
ncbi:hypothetical protein M067_2818 [Bacteroides fragilis str. J-143-4]|nr:hypothetical protein M067_2818 [Bacteroides fragilis str. J-143-4]